VESRCYCKVRRRESPRLLGLSVVRRGGSRTKNQKDRSHGSDGEAILSANVAPVMDKNEVVVDGRTKMPSGGRDKRGGCSTKQYQMGTGDRGDRPSQCPCSKEGLGWGLKVQVRTLARLSELSEFPDQVPGFTRKSLILQGFLVRPKGISLLPQSVLFPEDS